MKLATFTAAIVATTALTALQGRGGSHRRRYQRGQRLAVRARQRRSGHPAYSPGQGVAFKPSDHVYIKSALAVDFTYRKATVTLPLYRGLGPDGKDVFYILTDASDFHVAKRMGLNYSPKLRWAKDSAGAQPVTLNDGVMQFEGAVDFSPVYKVVPGDPPTYFPPKEANPGAVADAKWSSIVVLPSGQVLNAQIVQNASGAHLRLVGIDLQGRSVTMLILDGDQGGKQYFYHMVTDASAAVPAVLEKGVFAPTLAKIPAFGRSLPTDHSALLAFSPVLNGRTDKGSGEDQGFSTALANGGIDPINVFPVGPDNDDPSKSNNYSPLWDAHVSMWTDTAVKEHKVHRIHSIAEQKELIKAGLLTSAFINPPGPATPTWAVCAPPTRSSIALSWPSRSCRPNSVRRDLAQGGTAPGETPAAARDLHPAAPGPH